MSEHKREHIHVPHNLLDKATDAITTFVGSWVFLGASAVWFVLWIVLRVEPFPFGLLTMIVSLEAIFLSTLVMMSQNRQAAKDRKRDDLESVEVSEMDTLVKAIHEINVQQSAILERLNVQPTAAPRKRS